MAILVDELREYPHTRLPFRHWCHLVSDHSFEELHAFAARIGIPRHRFQGDHYDLPPHLRSRAVELGARGGRHARADAADDRRRAATACAQRAARSARSVTHAAQAEHRQRAQHGGHARPAPASPGSVCARLGSMPTTVAWRAISST